MYLDILMYVYVCGRKADVELGRRISTGRLSRPQSSTGKGRQCRPRTADSFSRGAPRHTATAGSSAVRSAAASEQTARLARPTCLRSDADDAGARTGSAICRRHRSQHDAEVTVR